jgi:hypothetical protein
MGKKRAKANYRRTVVRLPDLDHSKTAVLNSLTSPGSAPRLPTRHRTVHRLVLLGAPPSFQSHRCRSLPHLLGRARSCCQHN